VSPPFGRLSSRLEKAERAPMQRHEGGYYIRLTVHDRLGVAAGVASRMAEAKISIESIVQKRPPGSVAASDKHGRGGEPVPLVLITYAATEGSIRAALEKIAADGLVAEEPQVIRIERE
jgi:homoserine dehydrogenase